MLLKKLSWIHRGVLPAVLAAALWPTLARADESCDAIVARLSSSQPDGRGTLDLERKAQLGNCTAAAQLVRRARDAEGYAKIHCPESVQDISAGVLKLGQKALDTPECQG